jgi:DNA-directed RNA polymerase subunit RPC12/RpoP
LGKEALDMQAEIADLRAENAELKKKRDIVEKLIRHEEAYITKSDDTPTLYYCAPCWDVNEILVQLFCDKEDGSFICPNCKSRGIYDLNKYNAKYHEEPDDADSNSYFGW